MKFSIAVVCDLEFLVIGLRSVVVSTLGGGGSTVSGTLDLVRRATGSYYSLFDSTLSSDGAALGVWMTILGSEAWGWTVA